MTTIVSVKREGEERRGSREGEGREREREREREWRLGLMGEGRVGGEREKDPHLLLSSCSLLACVGREQLHLH